jgi:hypothetical protein
VFIGEGFDLSMSECADAVSIGQVVLVTFQGVLQGLARMLVAGQVILLSLLLAGTMGVGCAVV